MKTILVFVAILGLSLAAPRHHSLVHEKAPAPRSLEDDLLDFVKLLPIDDIKTILDKHVETDGALAAVIEYLQGPDWARLVEEVLSKPEVKDFVKYLTDAGLPVDVIIAAIHEIIHNAKPGVKPDEKGSLRPLLDEIEGILPVDDLLALLDDKMQNSPDFQDLYTTISSEKARKLVEDVRHIEEVQRLAQRLRELGVKVDEALAVIYEWLGWGKPVVKRSSRSLEDDLLEFVNLLPIDDIKAILDKHVETDGALAAVIEYLQGPEWADLVKEVLSKPEVVDFVKYLTDAGLPVDVIIAAIHEIIHNAKPGVKPDEKGSLRPLLDEIEGILPVDDLLALLDDKMQNSPDFQDLYTTISSEKARKLVEDVRHIEEVQRLAQRLRELGVKVDEALAVIYEWLGWGKP